MKTIGTYALAFALATVAPAMAYSLFYFHDDFVLFLVIFLIGTVFVGFFVFYLAFPAFLLFQFLGLVNIWTSVTVGFAIGCLAGELLSDPRDSLSMLPFGALGAIGGLVFWLVIRCGKEQVLTETPPTESTP